jgi:hypothetical protein
MIVTLVAPSISSWIPSMDTCLRFARGAHPVLVPNGAGLVTIDTNVVPLHELLGAGFSISGYSAADND